MDESGGRVAWFNGRFVPEREVLIPFRDLSFLRGYGAFDLVRSFHGKSFKMEEHIERLYQSLRYLDIDPGLAPREMIELSEEVLARNRHLLTEDSDYWIAQRVSGGMNAVGDEGWDHRGPNVIVECRPLPIKKRAKLFRDGIRVITPATTRTPPRSLSPRAKMHQYLNVILAGNDVKRLDPEAWAVLLDENGNLAEGEGSNIFLVKKGVVLTPREKYVLPGVSRATVLEIAAELGVTARETDLDLFDAAVADEMFIASTSLCICPVSAFNGRKIGSGVPGPVTARLMARYAEIVGCDFVAQHTRQLASAA